jgi:hypothetical protein
VRALAERQVFLCVNPVQVEVGRTAEHRHEQAGALGQVSVTAAGIRSGLATTAASGPDPPADARQPVRVLGLDSQQIAGQVVSGFARLLADQVAQLAPVDGDVTAAENAA